MITFLYDKNNSLISNLIHSAILNPDIIKVRNKLLDGTYHIQSVGKRVNEINIICYVDKIGKEKMDNLYVTDEPIKLVKEGKFYIGLIFEKSKWEVFSKGTKGLYQTSFKMVVHEEGSI